MKDKFRQIGIQLTTIIPLLVVVDLGTKAWISAVFKKGESKNIIPGFFDLTLVHNTGAAFGMGNRWPMAFFTITSFLAIGVVVYLLLKLKPQEVLSRWGLLLILGGALGNLVDRFRFGYVVDFLEFYVGKYHYPAFNAADAYITVGAILFAIDVICFQRKREKEEVPEVSFKDSDS